MNFPVEKREHENQPPAISSSSAQGLGSSLPKWWGGGVYFPSFISLFRCLLISLRRFIVFCRSRHSTKSSNSILHSFAARVAPIPCAHSIHSFSKAWHRAGILWGCSALWIVIHWSKSMPSLFCTSKKGMATLPRRLENAFKMGWVCQVKVSGQSTPLKHSTNDNRRYWICLRDAEQPDVAGAYSACREEERKELEVGGAAITQRLDRSGGWTSD